MILKIRTKDNLEELVRHRNSPSWVIAEYRENQIKKVEIYQFDGKKVLKADFDLIRSSRTEDNRLIVAFSNAIIEDTNYTWVGQNPINYEDINSNMEKLTREQLEKEIADGVYFDRRIEIAKLIFEEFKDSTWAESILEESFTDYNDLEEGIIALKFLYHELNKKETAIKLIKRDLERISRSTYESGLFANLVLNDIKDKNWAVEIIETCIVNITSLNTEELYVCEEFGNAAIYVLNNFNDTNWSSSLFDIAISKMRTNIVASEFNTKFIEYLNQPQSEILKNKIKDLPDSVEDYDPKENVDESNLQNANSLIIRIDLKGFELSDYELLQADELGILDVKSSIENYFPSNEISYQLVSATEEEIELEEECIHVLWSIIDIEDQDPNDYIPNNQDIFLELSAELETRICCFIVPENYSITLDNSNLNFEDILNISNEKYMSYLEGDFDSGFYM
jgi:hypothetical protein